MNSKKIFDDLEKMRYELWKIQIVTNASKTESGYDPQNRAYVLNHLRESIKHLDVAIQYQQNLI